MKPFGGEKMIFPFSAILGQEDLKLCLILNAIHPGIGGVLVRGEKGTAKSTIVRGLTDLLPETRVVTLPLNATEDRVAGGMDFNRAVKEGKKILLPGLLAEADQGILYVDEINLLDDHIVDVILDAAVSGENRVEREGISFCHDARFLLVGTMNPEEGDLRPQLLDRFGFCVEVASEKDPEVRIDLMERRELYDRDPAAFRTAYESRTQKLAQKIAKAKKLLPRVRMRARHRSFIAELCSSNHVAGHRADLVIEQAARAHAAFLGQVDVDIDDISAVAKFALLHRKQDVEPPPPEDGQKQKDNSSNDSNESDSQDQSKKDPDDQNPDSEKESPEPKMQDQEMQEPGEPEKNGPDSPGDSDGDGKKDLPQPEKDVAEQIFEIGATFKVKKITTPRDRKMRRGSGRRSRSRVSRKQGRYVNTSMQRTNNDVAFDATLRAAAPYQLERKQEEGLFICLKPEDIREKIREKRIGNFLVFLVDASGSMGAKGRMTASKGAVLSLLLDAYQKRDRVAMISFRKSAAYVNLPPTSSIELAAQYLAQMPVGGRTPLSAGLDKAFQMVGNMLRRDPATRPIVIIITDGKSNVAMGHGKPVDEAMAFAERMGQDDRVKYIVVDTEADGLVRFGLARKLAAAAAAQYCKIDDLQADSLVSMVKDTQ